MTTKNIDKIVKKMMRKRINENEIVETLKRRGVTDPNTLFKIQEKIRREYNYIDHGFTNRVHFSFSRFLYRFTVGLGLLALGLTGVAWKLGFIIQNTYKFPRYLMLASLLFIAVGCMSIFTSFKKSAS